MNKMVHACQCFCSTVLRTVPVIGGWILDELHATRSNAIIEVYSPAQRKTD